MSEVENQDAVIMISQQEDRFQKPFGLPRDEQAAQSVQKLQNESKAICDLKGANRSKRQSENALHPQCKAVLGLKQACTSEM